MSLADIKNFLVDGLWYSLGMGERYIYIDDLGEGFFGKVKRYRDQKTGDDVAFKTVDLEKSPDEYMEIQVLKQLSGKHPAFLNLVNATIEKKTAIIITDVAPGMELFKRLTEGAPLTVPQVKSAFYQLVEAMNTAHHLKITHRDLKPENIMIYENPYGKVFVKILDWGMALDGGEYRLSGGSPNYAAPEVLYKSSVVGPWNDVWSLGVVLFAMLTRKLPFDKEYIPHLFRQIREMDVNYSTPGLTPGAVNILKKIFVSHDARITCQAILGEEWLCTDKSDARI